MPGFHGSWSLGSFAGAALGTLGVAIGLSLSEQVLYLAAPSLLIVGLLTTQMLPEERTAATADSQRRESVRLAVRNMTIVVLGAIALADTLCEGAAAEWLAVYLRVQQTHDPGLRRAWLHRLFAGDGKCAAVRQKDGSDGGAPSAFSPFWPASPRSVS